jgi:hypothetical protein
MSDVEKINNRDEDVVDDTTQQPVDEPTEVDPDSLEEVAGGGDGTAIGYGKN